MNHERVTWYSPAVERHMSIRVFGHAGARVLVFPTTWGDENEWAIHGTSAFSFALALAYEDRYLRGR